MSSKIEQKISEIEDYLSECKYTALSKTNIVVNKDELEELLDELKHESPAEIRQYQKIISNKEAILADAQAKADKIIADATIHTNELVSEHQIMQQAYAQANEIVMAATNQAQEILNKATMDANAIQASAMAYTDEMLKSMEAILVHSIDSSKNRYDSLIMNLQNCLDVVVSNRMELNPTDEVPADANPTEQTPNQGADVI